MFFLQVLGPVQLRHDGSALPLRTHKALALLMMLALEGPSHRAQAAATLWPKLNESDARRNLRRELVRLRQAGATDAVVADGDVLALAAGLQCDAQLMADELLAGRAEAALAHWHGMPAKGLQLNDAAPFDDWLAAQRSRLAQLREQALQSAAAGRESTGDIRGALKCVDALLVSDPLHEEHSRNAMRLHALLDERAAALAEYKRLAEALQSELGLAPDAATQALAAQLLGGQALTSATPTTAAVAAPLLADRLPFVGRTAARATIEAAWASGRRVYLSGVPGAGKTRLATECVAAQGAWLRVACSPSDAELPYSSAVRALRLLQEAAPDVTLPVWVRRELAALMPELGAAPKSLASAEAAERLHAAFVSAWRLLVHDNFNALVLDDWQWGDSASVALWNRLDDAGTPVRWIVAYRSAQLPPLALQRAREEVDSGRAVHVELEGFDAEEALGLVRALSGSPGGALFAGRLQQATGGNPFFLIETLRHLFEQGQLRAAHDGTWSTPIDDVTHDYAELPVPASVKEVVLGRVRALGQTTARLLEAASLLGDGIDLALLEGVTPATPAQTVAALEHAQAARLVVAAGPRQIFAHDLVRQCLADSLSPSRRRQLHQALAQRLEALAAAPALVAAHWEGAGQRAAAITWRRRAAEEAWRKHAIADTRQHYALALADGAAGRDAVEIHLGLARTHRREGDATAAAAAMAAAVQMAQHGDAQTLLDARLACAEDWLHNDRIDKCVALLEVLSADLAAAPAPQRARALATRATAEQWQGQLVAARASQAQAMVLLEGLPGALLQRAELLDAAARTAATAGDMVDCSALCLRAAAAFEAAGDDANLAQTLLMLGVAALHGRNDRAAAAAAFERARTLAAGCGHVPAQRGAILNLVKLHTDAGRSTPALALLDEGEALAPGFEHQRAEQAFLEARYYLHYLRGEVAQARAAAERLLLASERVASRDIRAAARLLVLDFYLHTGELARACALLDEAEALSDADTAGQALTVAALRSRRAWCLLAQGEPRAALEKLRAPGGAGRAEDSLVVAWVGCAAALALDDLKQATEWLVPVDIQAEYPTDALAMLLVQHLRLACACRGEAASFGHSEPTSSAAQGRGAALLEEGLVPAFEAELLRAALAQFTTLRC